MVTVFVIGIGPGDPELVTVKAIRTLNRADLVLIPRKGEDKADLADLRRDICRRYLDNPAARLVEFDLPRRRDGGGRGYRAAVTDWHDAIAATYAGIIRRELADGGSLALLVWGDPSLYDSTLRILERLPQAHGVPVEVEMIPGITSVQALSARHAMPLNTLGGSVLITTGRRLREEGAPAGVDTIVVMLDGENSFRAVPADDFDIQWGGYVGLDQEILASGPLAEQLLQIPRLREAARERNGWIMDTTILRRKGRK